MTDETQPTAQPTAEAAPAASETTADALETSAKAAVGAAATATEAVADASATHTKAAETLADRATNGARRAGEALKASGEKAAEGRTTIGLRMIEQAEANAHEAFAAMRQAAGAKDMTEIMRIQADYLRKQGSRAVEQAREIGELIARFGRETTAPLRPDRKD